MTVAAYCRVSTDQEDQANSFVSQQRYFRAYIERHPDWELFDIYADEGVTGTSTKKRTQFNRMIRDASLGKFNLILTKEVSRFSRNILDTISYTRQLKEMGVGVFFVTDGIHSLKPDAELYLAIMASLAQEESRKTSARVVWGQTRQMERGVVFGTSMLGYDVERGNIRVNPEGAETVRLIFQKYALEQVSTGEIAKYLTLKGYRTYRGSTVWKPGSVLKILHNEKYAGDLIQKKTYTPDFLTHEKKRNAGQVPRICIENHHEPIVSREVWNLAQERLRQNNRHTATQSGHSNRYVFSGRIKCGECGASYVGRFQYRRDGRKIRRWCCGTVVREGAAACTVGKLVRDDDAMEMLKHVLRSLPIDTGAIVSNITALVTPSGEGAVTDDSHRLSREIARIEKKKEAMLDSYFSREITKEDMLAMKHSYEQKLICLRQHLEKEETGQENRDSEVRKAAVAAEVLSILNGETESDLFYKTILHSLTVFRDRHMELRLNYLDQVFPFTG